jgi:hypothetical protein
MQVILILFVFGLSFGGVYATSAFLLRRRFDTHMPHHSYKTPVGRVF